MVKGPHDGTAKARSRSQRTRSHPPIAKQKPQAIAWGFDLIRSAKGRFAATGLNQKWKLMPARPRLSLRLWL
jgi:hypothetical protein